MHTYKVVFNYAGKIFYRKAIEYIQGYSQEDALLRSGYHQSMIESITIFSKIFLGTEPK